MLQTFSGGHLTNLSGELALAVLKLVLFVHDIVILEFGDFAHQRLRAEQRLFETADDVALATLFRVLGFLLQPGLQVQRFGGQYSGRNVPLLGREDLREFLIGLTTTAPLNFLSNRAAAASSSPMSRRAELISRAD